MRLIDADRLKTHSDIKNWDKPYGCSFSVIDEQPTVEAKPVVHGEWIAELDWDGWIRHECSTCGYAKRTDVHVSLGWNFCPNCGADMRGGKDD